MTKISFCTFGCKVNQYETEKAAEQAREAGLEVVAFGEPADIQVVHTCSITSAAVRDGRQALRRARRDNPEGKVVATGCAVRTDAETLHPGPEVAFVDDLATAVALEADGLAGLGGDSPCSTAQGQARTRALLKIHDGCFFRCTFCIVPRARPVESSKPLDEALEEARRYVASGHREIVLTGVRITGYRPDGYGRSGLTELIKRLGDIGGLCRVRVTTLYPSEVRGDLLDAIADSPNACCHLHLAMQSGDDEVLSRMDRRYTAALFEDVVCRARERMPDLALSTDVIVGFPGETDEQFENTAALMERVAFSRAHVFPYSQRPGTQAAEMAHQVPAAVARERTRRLIAVANRTGRAFRQKMVGNTEAILVEQRRPDGQLSGLTDRYIECRFKGADDLLNKMVTSRITELTDSGVCGIVI